MGARIKVLLVDDEPSLRKVVKKRLELAQYDVAVAADGYEALQYLREERPDVIVLDVMMPRLNGFEVCARLKQDPQYRTIPVVMLTARAHARDEQLARECGADGYVRKPFRAEEFLDTMTRCRIRPVSGPPLCLDGWHFVAQRLGAMTAGR